MQTPQYQRVQTLWLLWLTLPAPLIAILLTAWFQDENVAQRLVGLSVLLMCLIPLVLGRFTVEVGQGAVEWRFGYLGRPRWTLPLAEIKAVEVASTTWPEGWGIRFTRQGMLYNASGTRAVRLILRDGRQLRLGSDEPERLAAFIMARL
jgi:hypothetical protein